MQIIFIDNSNQLTSSLINFKALDSIQKILIYFSEALSSKDHKVTVYNNRKHKKNNTGVIWNNISELSADKADVLILFQDIDLIKYKVEAKVKFLFLYYEPFEKLNNQHLIELIKKKFCILYSCNYVVSTLPHNFNYVPKLRLDLGVDESYINSNIINTTYSNVFVNTHPLKGLDWLIKVWLKYIHTAIPWAELHIYSNLLSQNISSNNIKVRNLKLTLELNRNCGIFIKTPLPQKEFLLELVKYKLHLCPSLDSGMQYLSLLESQACGIPVIAREAGPIYECIYNNETGFIVKDELTFSRKVIQVLNDNKLFTTLRNNSKLNNHVISWQDTATNFERKLNENSFYR